MLEDNEYAALTTWTCATVPGEHVQVWRPEVHTDEAPVSRLETLGKYRLLRRLGSGGMGDVFAARTEGIPGEVAVKTLRRVSPEGLLSLKREFRRTASIRHPGLVSLYELAQVDDIWFFSMELVAGTGLLRHVWKGDEFPGPELASRQLLALLPQLLNALEHLHAHQVLHLDVKPSNILVTVDGCVKLLDFGISEVESRAGARLKRFAGTPAYMAPEQAWGEISKACDYYALGATLFEAVTGKLPIRSLAGLRLNGSHEPPTLQDLNGAVPPALCQLIDALLSRNPEGRPLVDDIRARLNITLNEAPRVSSSIPPQRLFGRERELRFLADTIDRSATRPIIVMVSAASGLGKTSLLGASTTAWELTSALVVSSRCFEWQAIPFKACDPLVDQLCSYLETSDAALHLPPDLALARQMFPVLEGLAFDVIPTGSSDPLVQRTRAARALGQLLAQIAVRRPVVLTVDDVHWGDIESAEILGNVMDVVSSNVVLVVTSRPESAASEHFGRRLTGIASGCDVVQLALEPLDVDQSIALVRAAIDVLPHSESQLNELVADAGGVPIFLEQIGCLLTESNIAVGSLSESFALRRARLEPYERMLLDVVSVAGHPTKIGDLLEVAASESLAPETSIHRMFANLQSESLIRCEGLSEDSLVEPYHDRVRRAIVACVSTTFADRTHRQLAKRLEQTGQSPARIAEHWHMCGELELAANNALRGGRIAYESLAFENARDLYEKSFTWNANLRQSHLDDWGYYAWSLYQTGRCKDAGLTFADVARINTGDGARRQRGYAVEALIASGEVDKACSILNELLDDLGIRRVGSSRWRTLHLVLLILNFRWQSWRYRSRAPNASALIRAEATWAGGKALTNLLPVEGMILLLRSLLFALRSGHAGVLARGLSIAASGYVPFLESSSHRLLSLSKQLVAGETDAYLDGLFGVVQATSAHMAGDWALTLGETDRALQTLESANVPTNWERSLLAAHRTTALEQLGDMTLMREYATRAAAASMRRGDLVAHVSTISALGFTFAAANETDALARVIREMSAIISSWTVDYGVWHSTLWRLRVILALRQGDHATALQLHDFEWPKIEAALLLHTRALRCLLLEVRAAVLLNRPIASKKERLTQRYQARIIRRQLQTTNRRDAAATTSVVRAAECRLRGDTQRAIQHLGHAAVAYANADMRERCAVVRWQIAILRREPDETERLREELAGIGVTGLETWALYRVPGFA